MRLVRLAPIGALALTVAACGTLRPASVGGGECRVFERPEYAVLGQTHRPHQECRYARQYPLCAAGAAGAAADSGRASKTARSRGRAARAVRCAAGQPAASTLLVVLRPPRGAHDQRGTAARACCQAGGAIRRLISRAFSRYDPSTQGPGQSHLRTDVEHMPAQQVRPEAERNGSSAGEASISPQHVVPL